MYEDFYLNELEPMRWFLAKREQVTKRPWEIIEKGESPDFVVRDTLSGRRYGVEWTDARPPMSVSNRRWLQEIGLDRWSSQDCFEEVWRLVQQKEEKRKKAFWRYPGSAVLVIRCHNSLLDMSRYVVQLAGFYSPRISRRYVGEQYLGEHGFKEIWLQDVEPTFWKDGEELGAAILNLFPWWGRRSIHRLHREFEMYEGGHAY